MRKWGAGWRRRGEDLGAHHSGGPGWGGFSSPYRVTTKPFSYFSDDGELSWYDAGRPKDDPDQKTWPDSWETTFMKKKNSSSKRLFHWHIHFCKSMDWKLNQHLQKKCLIKRTPKLLQNTHFEKNQSWFLIQGVLGGWPCQGTRKTTRQRGKTRWFSRRAEAETQKNTMTTRKNKKPQMIKK